VTDGRPIALVTGGARGIGLGIAAALATDGWDLALAGLRAVAEVEETVRTLAGHGGRVHYVQADISAPADRTRLVADVERVLGTPSALVNNAGRAPRARADLLDATEDSFDEVLATNLRGPYFLTQAVVRRMVAAGVGTQSRRGVVFVTSVSAELASPERGEYCVSKAGLSMAVKLFALRLAADAIPVYEVRPGIIATDMTAAVKDKYDRRIADGLIPDARWGTPDDVAKAVAALLRGDVPYATGSVLHVDGGLAIPRL
jgi:NAD(P)-dependent dehydrogenase (short-subunit alcohol dehydrogenase family)